MKLFLITVILLGCSFSVFAQFEGKGYTSFQDIAGEDSARILSGLMIKKRNTNQLLWNGGREYKMYTKDKGLNKKIKGDFVAIEVNDSLYLNMHKMKYQKRKFGNGYVYAFTKEGSVFFVTYPFPSDKVGFNPGVVIGVVAGVSGGIFGGAIGGAIGGALGGAIGGSAEARPRLKRQVYYELNPEDNQITLVDVERLKELLNNSPTLLEELSDEAEMPERETVCKYMQLWKEIEDK